MLIEKVNGNIPDWQNLSRKRFEDYVLFHGAFDLKLNEMTLL